MNRTTNTPDAKRIESDREELAERMMRALSERQALSMETPAASSIVASSGTGAVTPEARKEALPAISVVWHVSRTDRA